MHILSSDQVLAMFQDLVVAGQLVFVGCIGMHAVSKRRDQHDAVIILHAAQ